MYNTTVFFTETTVYVENYLWLTKSRKDHSEGYDVDQQHEHSKFDFV